MKPYRLLSLLLTLCLLLGMAVPSAEAAKLDPDLDKICPYALLEDMDTDTVLYSRASDEKIYPASTTKLVTALVILRHIEAGDLSLDTVVKCSKHVQDGMTDRAAKAMLQKGEHISVENLLYLLMLPSHCDAGNALAEAVSGSVKKFAKEMNAVAEELGCTGTHFTNPHGLHDDEHYTTCADMYRLAKAAYEYEDYRKIISTVEYTVPATDKHPERKIHNTNALISDKTYGKTYLYKYCTGGKTGSTFQAQYCLVSYAEKDGRRLCCVMMHSEWYLSNSGSKMWMQYIESERLYRWGFKNFTEKTLVEENVPAAEVTVENAREDAPLPLVTAAPVTALVEKSLKLEMLTLTPELTEPPEAPIDKGQVMGRLHILSGDEELGCVDLLAGESRSPMPKILEKLDGLTHQPRGTFPLVPVLCLVSGVLLLTAVLMGRRKPPHRSRRKTRK